MKDKELIQQEPQEEPAPIFKNWQWWYGLVLGNLIFLIVFFYIFTKAFK